MAKQVYFVILEGATSHTTESAFVSELQGLLESPKQNKCNFIKSEISIRTIKNFGSRNGIHIEINKYISNIKLSAGTQNNENIIVAFIFDDDIESSRKQFNKILSKIECKYKSVNLFYKDGNFDNFLLDFSCQKSINSFKKNICEKYKEENAKLLSKIMNFRDTKIGFDNLFKYRKNYSDHSERLIEWIISKFDNYNQ